MVLTRAMSKDKKHWDTEIMEMTWQLKAIERDIEYNLYKTDFSLEEKQVYLNELHSKRSKMLKYFKVCKMKFEKYE